MPDERSVVDGSIEMNAVLGRSLLSRLRSVTRYVSLTLRPLGNLCTGKPFS